MTCYTVHATMIEAIEELMAHKKTYITPLCTWDATRHCVADFEAISPPAYDSSQQVFTCTLALQGQEPHKLAMYLQGIVRALDEKWARD